MSVMTEQQFKARWESDERGGGITFDDIANCAESWGLFATPRICPIDLVRYQVLKAAETADCEEFAPSELEA